MSSAEESFPRGGTQKKAKDGKVATRQIVDQDNLFKVHHEEQTQKRKKKQQDEVMSKKLKVEKKTVVKASAKDFALLTAQSLTEGILLLGCVKESNEFELVMSLPNGLTGYVQVTRICDAYNKMLNKQVDTDEFLEGLNPLTDLFSPGMLLRCAVVDVEKTAEGHPSIQLTINPKDVNKALNTGALKPGMLLSGCISSVEDHGYLIDIGVNGAKAFLPRQKTHSYLQSTNKGTELKLGQYLNCLIEEVKNSGRIVRMSINQSEVAASMATEKQSWALSNLLPGLVVKAQVQEVTPLGIYLSFLSSFTGIVDFMHLGPPKARNYSPGQMVKACIVAINHSSKTIRLSLRSVFLQPGTPLGCLSHDRIGMVVENSTVTHFYKKTGAIFTLDDGTVAFAHLKHLSDTVQSFKPEALRPESKHRCRIMEYSLMDDLVLLSLKQHIIDAPFLRYHDVQPGQVLVTTVLALKPCGMQVKVTDFIKGLVPRLHLADVLLKHPEKKYNVGTTIKCRVLVSNPDARNLILTRKRTLINSKLPVLASYQDAKPGLVTHGFIVCAREFGCIVKFYNDVKGLVPKNELGLAPITAPQEAFYEGQVVKVVVLKCEPEQERLLLSFKVTHSAENRAGEEKSKKRDVTYATGQIVDVKILKKKGGGLEVAILPNDVSAYLPMMHLSDHVTNCTLWWHWLKEDDILHRVVCLHDKGGHITLSRKPAVISAMENEQVVKSFSDIQPGLVLTGYVRNIMSYGVFVEFPYGLTGLAPKSAMSDKFVTNTQDHFVIGQTVVAKVTSIDEEKQRILLSLKMSDCCSEDSASEGFALLCQYFKELQEIKSIMRKREDSSVAQKLCELRPRQRVELVVQEVKADGSALFSGSCVSGLSVIATHNHLGGKSVVAGEKVNAVILYIDFLKSEICVSLREELLFHKVEKLKNNSQHPAIVQYVATDYAVASLVGSGRLIALPVAYHFNDTFRFDSEKLKVGHSVVAVVLKTVQAGEYGTFLAVQGSSKKKTVIRPRRESETLEEPSTLVKHTLSLGDMVKGTVKSIKATHVLVAIKTLTGSIHASQILDDVPIGTIPTSKLRVGQKVTARVIGGRDVKTHRYLPITHPYFTHTSPELSIRPSDLKGESSTALCHEDNLEEMLKSFKPGQMVTCFVKKYNTIRKWLEVEVTPNIKGRVQDLLLTLIPKVLKHVAKNFKPGEALSAVVINSTETKLCLSLTGVCSLATGTITLGCVKQIIPHIGLVVALPFGKTGKVSLFHLSDAYREQPLESFSPGNIVRCYILSKEGNTIDLSLRQSRVYPKGHSKVEDIDYSGLDNIQKGQLVRGYVKSVKPSGIFFGLSHSIVGRIPLQYVAPFFVSEQSLYAKYIHVGQLLTAKVLRIDKEKNHIQLSLLPDDTGMPSVIPESLNLSHYEMNTQVKKRKRGRSESKQEVKPKKHRIHCTDEEDSGVEVYLREEEDEKCNRKSKQEKEVSRLRVSTSFSWEDDLNVLNAKATLKMTDQSSDSEEEKDTPSATTKQTKKKKELQKQKAEKELSKLEAALMDPTRQPQTADDFDRLLLGNPDSSILWLQYMAFHLQATEIEKARAVAERALKTISFREEQEKLNVWVALLNLENMYGTDEALMKVFERAIQYNEPLKVFQQLADIYTSSEKYKQADDLYNIMLKRFRQEKCVWVKYATFLLKRGLVEAAHRLLPRALKCLPDKEHVDVISKLAQLEFQFGDSEHGKAIFENTLSTYPKRTDIWSIYIDMMIKHGNPKVVREIFEQVIHMSLAAKKMKFFFKRYLEYEKKYGTAETVQAVKAAALEYVESKSSLSGS